MTCNGVSTPSKPIEQTDELLTHMVVYPGASWSKLLPLLMITNC